MIRFLSRRQRERDLDDEIRIHLEMAVRERVARGESREEAELAARREFGSVWRVKEATRAAWGSGIRGLLAGFGGAPLALAGGPALGTLPGYEVPTANDRLKGSFRAWFWTAMILAAFAHVAVFSLWPDLTASVADFDRDVLTVIPMPDIPIPAPPKPLPRPAEPVAASVDIPDDITIGRTDFAHNPVPTLAPPPTEEIARRNSRTPGITPHDVEPRLLNRAEVVRAMEREYPSVLRDAGIQGTVHVFFFVDETGRVADRRIDRSSGVAGLDAAALAVAETFRFSPAQNKDKIVPVWVSLPIVFQVR